MKRVLIASMGFGPGIYDSILVWGLADRVSGSGCGASGFCCWEFRVEEGFRA